MHKPTVTTTADALELHMKGTWRVRTMTSDYHVDLDALTIRRVPHGNSMDFDTETLGRDGEELALMGIERCVVDDPEGALFLIAGLRHGVVVERRTNPVRSITQRHHRRPGAGVR